MLCVMGKTQENINTSELLEAYTKAHNSHCKILHQKDHIEAQLDEAIKEQSRKLRKTVARIVRGSGWVIDDAKYWHLIAHGTQPVTSSIRGYVKVLSWSKECGRCNMEFDFTPDTVDCVLGEIRRIVRNPEQVSK